jgi:hypothetical protein
VTKFARLTVNVRLDVMEAIKRKAADRGTSITDEVHRMAKVLDILERRVTAGDQLALVKPNGDIRELEIL